MKRFIFSLFICSVNTYAVETKDASTIRELIKETILKHQAIENSGVAVAVFNSKEIVLSEGYGYADREAGRVVTNKTAFAIGSTTKAFTALGIKLLENEGKLALTDKVISHLPDFRLANQNIANEVTIEDMLSHRVGMPRHDLMWLYTPFNRDENYFRMQFLAFPEKAEENFRKNFVYNNFMFMVAGRIIEARTNQSFEDFVTERIFKSLDMQNTFVTVPSNYTDLAEPYFKEIKVPHRNIIDMGPAGSIYSTAEDMTKWIQSLMNNKWENQKDLFRARIAIDSKNPTLDYGYGLGWMANTMNKNYSWYLHDGAIDGFSTVVLFSQDLDLGVVALVNQNGSGLGGEIVTAILKAELAKRPLNKSFRKQTSFKLPRLDVTPVLSVGEKYTARENQKAYEDEGYGLISTFSSEGKTFIDYYGNVWETKSFEHEYFNFLTDLVLGADHYEFPVRVTDDKLVAPFQSEVPMIEFDRIEK